MSDLIPSPRPRTHPPHVYDKVTTRHGWLGDYDYAWLCMPTLPCASRRDHRKTRQVGPPFYSLDSELPIVVAVTAGLQHALAMLAGLITPPIIFASSLALDPETSAYMISASLIGSGASSAPHPFPPLTSQPGILSLVQMSRIHLFRNFYLGTGLLSVVGTSFSALSTANSVRFTGLPRPAPLIRFRYSTICMPTAHVPPPPTRMEPLPVSHAPTPTATSSVRPPEPLPSSAYPPPGTSLICSFLEISLSFVPPRTLKRIFPPMVTGTVILLIGASLIGSSGIPNWGGGSNCAGRPASGAYIYCPSNTSPRPALWGSPQMIGLGFLSFVSIILTELFGSPFLKNTSIIVGLAVGCIVAGAAGYIDGSTISTAPAITFLWVKTFKIRVYPPAILPMLAVYSKSRHTYPCCPLTPA